MAYEEVFGPACDEILARENLSDNPQAKEFLMQAIIYIAEASQIIRTPVETIIDVMKYTGAGTLNEPWTRIMQSAIVVGTGIKEDEMPEQYRDYEVKTISGNDHGHCGIVVHDGENTACKSGLDGIAAIVNDIG